MTKTASAVILARIGSIFDEISFVARQPKPKETKLAEHKLA